MTEIDKEWEIADDIAKYLVKKKRRKSPDMLQSEDMPVLKGAVKELGLKLETEDYHGLMGKVNAKLCDYWA